jgi:hypothetical protein
VSFAGRFTIDMIQKFDTRSFVSYIIFVQPEFVPHRESRLSYEELSWRKVLNMHRSSSGVSFMSDSNRNLNVPSIVSRKIYIRFCQRISHRFNDNNQTFITLTNKLFNKL